MPSFAGVWPKSCRASCPRPSWVAVRIPGQVASCSTIGWVNFLHDRSQTPYMRLGDIDAHFGISESTGAAKLAAIRKMLKIYQLDPNWTLPSRLDDNPMAWILEVNGFPGRRPQCPKGGAGDRLQQGPDPVHSSGSGRRGVRAVAPVDRRISHLKLDERRLAAENAGRHATPT